MCNIRCTKEWIQIIYNQLRKAHMYFFWEVILFFAEQNLYPLHLPLNVMFIIANK